MDWATIGRVLLASYFVGSGLRHFFIFDDVAGAVAQRGVPLQRVMLTAGTAFEIAAGVLLAAGLWLIPVTAALAAFTLAASAMLMDFWNKAGPERGAAVNGWLANIAVIGGLIVVTHA